MSKGLTGGSMKHIQQLTAIIEREGDGYVSLCPEIDIAAKATPSRLPAKIYKKR
jgi:hypothetical protein